VWHVGGGRPQFGIEALKNEVKTLEAKKTRLVGEVDSLLIAHAELEEL